ncbi:MAG: ribulose-phosphate 3-epimerase [Eubacteriaceae bacterium]|nr:ribulose-phosphate 3-epimerase [Eubacteriaceae bacterium]
MKELAPSILSADFSKLGEEVAAIEKGGAQIIHFDVMDGHFVPNISYGAVVLKSLLGKTKLPFDVHLMIEDPDLFLEEFATDSTEYITVHQEACTHLDRTVKHIKSLGIKAGVAINPATPVSALECILDEVDMILVMSVNPGFGGQSFIESTLKKTKALSLVRDEMDRYFKIEMDGGISLDNVGRVLDAGTDIAVAGSSVFHSEDIAKRTGEFLSLMGE